MAKRAEKLTAIGLFDFVELNPRGRQSPPDISGLVAIVERYVATITAERAAHVAKTEQDIIAFARAGKIEPVEVQPSRPPEAARRTYERDTGRSGDELERFKVSLAMPDVHPDEVVAHFDGATNQLYRCDISILPGSLQRRQLISSTVREFGIMISTWFMNNGYLAVDEKAFLDDRITKIHPRVFNATPR
ncbi:MAG: hypothetical protein AAF628_32020 [Planctomycetota bacterium]